MTNKVLYLCRSSKAKRGWVFPDEEEDGDFPGGFFIEEQAGKLGSPYNPMEVLKLNGLSKTKVKVF